MWSSIPFSVATTLPHSSHLHAPPPVVSSDRLDASKSLNFLTNSSEAECFFATYRQILHPNLHLMQCENSTKAAFFSSRRQDPEGFQLLLAPWNMTNSTPRSCSPPQPTLLFFSLLPEGFQLLLAPWNTTNSTPGSCSWHQTIFLKLFL
ncbi:uncharacterized protein CELE_Y73B3A.8 [Caenorhabditis elegans]|uniref:Secreted protein n=1 Tax=Caenorhabditis elegans TaxID=6239 RepID=Q95XF7_CAEEL|nr:Secreted protein [Caenorhabditis elegans]CCD74431.2 Secreted protein [Caenorhabditis elegans]